MSSAAGGIVAMRNKRRSASVRGGLGSSQRDLSRVSQRELPRLANQAPRDTRRSSGEGSITHSASEISIGDGVSSAIAQGGEAVLRREQHRKVDDDKSSHDQTLVATVPVGCGENAGVGGGVGQGEVDDSVVGRDKGVSYGGNGDSANDDGKDSIRRFLRRLKNGRNLCGRIVNNQRVQLFVVVLIAVNAIMMGIGTFDFVTDDPVADARFELVDEAFLVLFTIELVMQIVYHGPRLFLDGWLVFDFVVIVMSWAFAQVQIIRAFRIFRALRLVTRIAVMRNLVTALFSVMPRMAAIALLLLLIMYIFAVMFTQLFKYMFRDGQTEFDYFSNLGGTFFTLFQIMTLDAWADVAREVMVTYPWAWMPFIVFVIISGFIVVNLIIAVICDAIATLHDDEKARLQGHLREDDEGGSEGSMYDGEGEGGDLLSGEAQQREIKELEDQIEQLAKIQEQTMKTLAFLTQQLHDVSLAQAQNTAETSKRSSQP